MKEINTPFFRHDPLSGGIALTKAQLAMLILSAAVIGTCLGITFAVTCFFLTL